MLRYALAIFLGAFLLFQVQPLIAKFILPWFGGGPAVWTTCMLFFQVLLLGGYAYAHVLTTALSRRRQVIVHLVVLVAAVAVLPIIPAARWKPTGTEDPTWRILLLLGASVGLPYFLLSTTSPLLQSWFSRTHPGRSPYRLYALSNLGSLLALVSYPFVVEPSLPLRWQAAWWSAGFGLFTLLCAWLAMRTRHAAVPVPAPEGAVADAVPAEPEARPGVGVHALWVALTACGSVMLLAVTNQMCADVAIVPFLWVLPLTLYLFTFILCFHSEKWYFRPVFWPLLFVAMGGLLSVAERLAGWWSPFKGFQAVVGGMPGLWKGGVDVPIIVQIIGYSSGMFICCMVCHGELVRLKPSPRYLTSFYLMSSLGGAVGGAFVSLMAPHVFRGYIELQIGMWLCVLLAIVAFCVSAKLHRVWREKWWVGFYPPVFLAALVLLALTLVDQAKGTLKGGFYQARNFYGVLRVTEYSEDDPDRHHFSLQHGRISHGCQFVSEEKRRNPTTYYGPKSGVGLAIEHISRDPKRGLKVGVVGLGTGTIAAYGKPGDEYRFYEINPLVRRLSGRKGVDSTNPVFTYLTESEAECKVILGDARVSLEREEPQHFDILALDAFTSDAIPIHLLTREAFEVYLRRQVKPEGILAVHISNRYLDLEPVVFALAEHFGYSAVVIESKSNRTEEIDSATWVLVTRNQRFLSCEPIRNVLEKLQEEGEEDEEAESEGSTAETATPHRVLWTDDYSNLFQVLK